MAYLLDTNWIIQFLAGHNETATSHKHIHPEIRPDLIDANLSETDLSGVDLRGAVRREVT